MPRTAPLRRRFLTLSFNLSEPQVRPGAVVDRAKSGKVLLMENHSSKASRALNFPSFIA